jgi:uncharacterized membrane protein
MDLEDLTRDTEPPRTRVTARMRLRNYFLTGIVVAAPISITIYLTWTFVNWVDGWAKPLIPPAYNPDTYLPISVPGVGLVFAFVLITLLGFLTANLVGRTIVTYGESLLDRMPLVRNLYRGLKQIFHTVLSESTRSFQKVGLIEYPRKGLWAIIFVSTDAKGEVADRLADNGKMLSVFLPTTPNPTSGFLLYVPEADVLMLDMSVEEAAKQVISAGLVSPEYQARTKKLAKESGDKDKSPPIAAE